MWTLILSLAAGLVVGGALRATDLVHSALAATLPGILVALVAAIFLFRRVAGRITPVIEEAQRHLQGGRRDMGLATLRSGLRWSRWHPLLEPQLRTQIGALLYDQQDYDGAVAELKNGAKTPWESRVFLACAYFKLRQEPEMVKAFEDAAKAGAKEDLYWTIYAWCLNAQGKKDEAQAVLKRGLEKLPGNQRLQGSLEALQEGKKVKVAPYGDRWARFGLDGSIATGGKEIPKAFRGFAQKPGFRQRPQRKR
jgi:tetratricopeptide (TPR) repeat protein